MVQANDEPNPEKALIEDAIRLAIAAVKQNNVSDRRAMEERALQKLREAGGHRDRHRF